MKKRISLLIAMLVAISALYIPQTIFANGVDYLYSIYVCTTDGYLNMREGSSTNSKIICELPDCARVDILSVSGNWGFGEYHTKDDMYMGWIYLPGTKSTYAAARDNAGKSVTKKLVIAADDGYMNLRREPSTAFDNIECRIYKGTEITVYRETDRGWGLTSYNGYTGWVSLSGTAAVPEPTPETEAAPETIPAHYTGLVVPEEGEVASGVDSSTIFLILIGVAIFLIIAVAILLIVILSRGKKVQSAQYDPYQMQQPYKGNQPYYNENNTNYPQE